MFWWFTSFRGLCVCVCVCVCVCACVRACVRVRGRACVRVVCACVVLLLFWQMYSHCIMKFTDTKTYP